jgi:hypothetical protein
MRRTFTRLRLRPSTANAKGFELMKKYGAGIYLLHGLREGTTRTFEYDGRVVREVVADLGDADVLVDGEGNIEIHDPQTGIRTYGRLGSEEDLP